MRLTDGKGADAALDSSRRRRHRAKRSKSVAAGGRVIHMGYPGGDGHLTVNALTLIRSALGAGEIDEHRSGFNHLYFQPP